MAQPGVIAFIAVPLNLQSYGIFFIGWTLTDDQLLDHIEQHPILIQRPIVKTPLGVRLCRPSEVVLDIRPNPQQGPFTKEDGEVVIGKDGQRA